MWFEIWMVMKELVYEDLGRVVEEIVSEKI